jgi:isoleucyl-tRNA synthetase
VEWSDWENGYWVDMEDPYVTYKPKYMETVWWLLKQIYNRFDVQRLHHSALLSKSRNRIELSWSESEGYRDVTDTTVVAQFKVLESSRELLCSKFYDYISSKNLQHYKASVLDDEIYFLAWQQLLGLCHLIHWLLVQNRLCFSKTFNQYLFFNEFDFG